MEHDLNHIDQLRTGPHGANDALLQRLQVVSGPPVYALVYPRGHLGGGMVNVGAAAQLAPFGSVI